PEYLKQFQKSYLSNFLDRLNNLYSRDIEKLVEVIRLEQDQEYELYDGNLVSFFLSESIYDQKLSGVKVSILKALTEISNLDIGFTFSEDKLLNYYKKIGKHKLNEKSMLFYMHNLCHTSTIDHRINLEIYKYLRNDLMLKSIRSYLHRTPEANDFYPKSDKLTEYLSNNLISNKRFWETRILLNHPDLEELMHREFAKVNNFFSSKANFFSELVKFLNSKIKNAEIKFEEGSIMNHLKLSIQQFSSDPMNLISTGSDQEVIKSLTQLVSELNLDNSQISEATSYLRRQLAVKAKQKRQSANDSESLNLEDLDQTRLKNLIQKHLFRKEVRKIFDQIKDTLLSNYPALISDNEVKTLREKVTESISKHTPIDDYRNWLEAENSSIKSKTVETYFHRHLQARGIMQKPTKNTPIEAEEYENPDETIKREIFDYLALAKLDHLVDRARIQQELARRLLLGNGNCTESITANIQSEYSKITSHNKQSLIMVKLNLSSMGYEFSVKDISKIINILISNNRKNKYLKLSESFYFGKICNAELVTLLYKYIKDNYLQLNTNFISISIFRGRYKLPEKTDQELESLLIKTFPERTLVSSNGKYYFDSSIKTAELEKIFIPETTYTLNEATRMILKEKPTANIQLVKIYINQLVKGSNTSISKISKSMIEEVLKQL
ncbi:MAG: hypothetical protein AAGF07_03210, partial [Patescibacteria group bacterium]